MPRRARAAVLPLSWTCTLKPLDSRWRIQSLQQPQVGAFQTCNAAGAAAAPAGTARAAMVAMMNSRRPDLMTPSP